MFGLFNKKKMNFNCPMCGITYWVKLNPAEFATYDYKYRNEASLISIEKCGFCKLDMSVVIFKSGSVKAYDDQWEAYEADYSEKIDKVHDRISEIEDELEENPDNTALKKELKRLEAREEKIEDSYLNKEEKYTERQWKWSDKREEKYG